MSGMMMIVIVGLVLIGGWCFIAGPCKGMLSGDSILKAGRIVIPSKVVKGTYQTTPKCGPGMITTPAGCAEAVTGSSRIRLPEKGFAESKYVRVSI